MARVKSVVSCQFWDWAERRGLTDAEKVVALYALTCKHANCLGCFHLHPGYAAADLGKTPDELKKIFQRLGELGFCMYDEETRYLFFPKWLFWQATKSKQVNKGIVYKALELPDSFKYFSQLLDSLERFGDGISEDEIKEIAIAHRWPIDSLSIGPEQLQLQLQLQEKNCASVAAPFSSSLKKPSNPECENPDGENPPPENPLPKSGPVKKTETPNQEGVFYLTAKKRKLTGWKLDAFNRFWAAYGLAKGKAPAADSWLGVVGLTREMAEKIILAAGVEARGRDGILAKGGTPKWAQGWLTERRWEDMADTGGCGGSQGVVYDSPEAAARAMMA